MPIISVILPVYNAEQYLQEAVDSILQQTFTDFELLLINDGSTDGSEQVILGYQDSRISYIKNEQNRGLIYSLNRAIDAAQGDYIARMDADDVALPERLEKQLAFLKKSNAAIVASRVKLIGPDGKPLPDWKDDAENLTSEQIKRFSLRDNCVAHPTVFGWTDIFKKYKYRYNQKYSEDYDLWLRLFADGHRIEKIAEPLLLHRILPTSATRFKKINVYYRLGKVKFRFLWQQLKAGRLTRFHVSVFLFATRDFVMAAGKEIKRYLQQ